MLCKGMLLGMCLAMVCVTCYVTTRHTTHTIARHIPHNVLLHNTLLVQWNYFMNAFKMTLARNNVAP